MKVYIPKYSGFCPGVKFAENKIFHLKKDRSNKKITVLGKLIHNNQYIEFLNKEGVLTADNIPDIDCNSLAIIRTHGIDKNSEAELRKNLEVIDLTCSKVKHLQKYIEEHSKNGYFVIITGKKDHPEVIGLQSYAEDSCVLEDEKGLTGFIRDYQKNKSPERIKGRRKILIVSQTTGNRGLFEKAARLIDQTFNEKCEVKVYDSICTITSLREDEAILLQKKSDVTFVIGDHISANANKLYQILKANSENTYFIENLNELTGLKLPLKSFKSALVVSSSSTPEFIEKDVIEHLLTA
jgi:4-hydroxy-3-methylbut-2-en-1-yl diphosphate reductase